MTLIFQQKKFSAGYGLGTESANKWTMAGMSGAFSDRLNNFGKYPNSSSFVSSHWKELCSVPTTAYMAVNISILKKTFEVGKS